MFCCDIESDMNVAERGIHFEKMESWSHLSEPRINLVDARTHDQMSGDRRSMRLGASTSVVSICVTTTLQGC